MALASPLLNVFPPSGRKWQPRPAQWVGLVIVLVGGLTIHLGVPPVIPALAGLLLIGLPSLWRATGRAEGPGGPDAPFAGRGKKIAGAVLLALLIVPVGPCVIEGQAVLHVLFVVLANGLNGALGACPAWVFVAAYAWLAAFFGVAAWQRPPGLRARSEDRMSAPPNPQRPTD